ncbi:hypothetical protein [uncultured Enterovirga sp.]|uniref:hypothetical protein n=1 Tax=uncultured Enterovirga sp. TaxID=2026352 RepID=UPI0035CB70FB
MRSSDPPAAPAEAAEPRWRANLVLAGALLGTALAVVAARIVWFDAYWLFRERPSWVEITGGANRLLDRQTRRGKVLQSLQRDYTVALLGSSTVYHGLDPAEAEGPFKGRVFNLGISALSGRELPIVASVVASRDEVRKVVIGLDYFMFSRSDGPAPLKAALSTMTGRAEARLGSVLGLYAIQDARIGRVAGGDDPGGWTRDGFRITPGLPPRLTQQNDATRRRTTVPYRPDMMGHLEAALNRLAGRDLDVYLAPVSYAQKRVLADLGLEADFARWRADAARIATAHGARFSDLVDVGADTHFDPAAGSTEAWLDNLHFTPVIGRRVLNAVGLRGPGADRP